MRKPEEAVTMTCVMSLVAVIACAVICMLLEYVTRAHANAVRLVTQVLRHLARQRTYH